MKSDKEWTLSLEGVSYLLLPCETSYLEDVKNAQNAFEPLVVYPVSAGDHISGSTLITFHDDRLKPDDIFQAPFLCRIVFYGCQQDKITLDESFKTTLSAWGTNSWSFVKPLKEAAKFPPGPYILGHDRLWQPWRIYEDVNLTMTMTFKPTNDGKDHSLAEMDSYLNSNQLRAVVPSRSYFERTKEKPLASVKIVTKDIFDVEGFRTSLCNRAWYDLYPPRAQTATSLKKLQDLGAILIGKTRLNAMIVREETMECVEFLAPFNPRGDGYQTSSGSSSGSCAALGSYQWVDMAIGSDTNGSSRKPAYWNGCYSIRPTHGVLDSKGLASFCPAFDVPAFFGRDLQDFGGLARCWYGDSDKLLTNPERPRTIYYPLDYFPTSNTAQMQIIDSFVTNLEDSIQVKKTPISLAEEWRRTSPQNENKIELDEYLRTSVTLPYYKDACGLLKNFVDAYKGKFNKKPFIQRALRWRWEISDKVSKEERDKGWERIATYKSWLLDHVFRKDAIMVLPIADGKPDYRDNPPPPFGLLSGFSPLYVSPIAGTPELTAPLGEISYFSNITERDEPLPISVAVVSPPGTDLMLIDLVNEALEKAGKIRSVVTGRSIFGGDTVMDGINGIDRQSLGK